MQLLRLVAVLVAGAVAAIGYWQETRRLETIRRLPGPKARDYYESVRSRGERVMWVFTAALAAGAVFAIIRAFVLRPAGPGT